MSYRAWSECDDDPDEYDKPNFSFVEVKFHWYKHMGRGLTSNILKSPDEWVDWFNRALAHVNSKDVNLRSRTGFLPTRTKRQ